MKLIILLFLTGCVGYPIYVYEPKQPDYCQQTCLKYIKESRKYIDIYSTKERYTYCNKDSIFYVCETHWGNKYFMTKEEYQRQSLLK